MANKIVVDTGKIWLGTICQSAGHASLNGSAKLHLFMNNYTIIQTSVLANVTEATYGGYAAQVLGTAVDGGIDANDRDTWTYPTLTFAATSGASLPQTIYGYYVTDNGSTTLLWAMNFSPTIVLAASGDGFTITPQFSYGSIF